jgi:hypothetical protein
MRTVWWCSTTESESRTENKDAGNFFVKKRSPPHPSGNPNNKGELLQKLPLKILMVSYTIKCNSKKIEVHANLW